MENRLKEARNGREIVWLSEQTGIHRNMLMRYENGALPRIDKAYKIAKVLGKPVTYIWPPE